jgi:hypothetical protein
MYRATTIKNEAEKALSAGANVVINARVYVLAEKDQIPVLKTHVIGKMQLALTTACNTVSFVKAFGLTWESTHDQRLSANTLLTVWRHSNFSSFAG